jgi:hypothetical protein
VEWEIRRRLTILGRLESVINSALKELRDNYIVDIKELGEFIAIFYLSEKKALHVNRE